MSRRDTIIIAVLINAGLLVVLFSTALKSNHAKEDIANAEAKVIAPSALQVSEIAVRKEISAPQSGDEVDQVLSQFSQNAPSAIEAPAQTAAVETLPKSDFVQDLNAISIPQTPAAVVAESRPSSMIEVTVRKGDVLDKIARQNQTSVEEIMRLNHLTSTNLKIGQVLKVSPSTKKVSAPIAQAPQKTETAAKFYTVKNGDNPWTIAVKNHMKVDELLKLNHLDAEKARHLKPGDQLRIR